MQGLLLKRMYIKSSFETFHRYAENGAVDFWIFNVWIRSA